MNQRKAKELSDEVQGADSKPPKEKEELSVGRVGEIPLPQL